MKYTGEYTREISFSLSGIGTGCIGLAGNGGEEFDNYLKLLNIGVVAVGNDIGGIPYVCIDDFAAMRDMTKSGYRMVTKALFIILPL